MEMGDRIRNRMMDLRDKARETFRGKSEMLRDKSEEWKDRGRETMENWRGNIESRPVTSLMVAFAVGLLCGALMMRKRD